MKYLQNRNIKQRIVKYLRDVFKVYSNWLNQDLEVIELTNDNAPMVHEQYPWDSENYCIVVVGGAGSDPDAWALNSFVDNTLETFYVGKEPNSYGLLTNDISVAFGVKPTDNFPIRNIGVYVKPNGNVDYDIALNLVSSSSGSPGNIIASGSIASSLASSDCKWLYSELSPTITLTKDVEYFVQLSLTNGSYGSYYLIEDNSPDLTVTPFVRKAVSGSTGWNVTSGSVPLGLVQGPIHRILGGGITTRFNIFIEAKDLATVQKISELVFLYLHVARHANMRLEKQLAFINSTRTEFKQIGDLANSGIHVVDLTKGSESVRERGNDRIFSLSLALTCYSNWAEAYGGSTLEEIDTTFENY